MSRYAALWWCYGELLGQEKQKADQRITCSLERQDYSGSEGRYSTSEIDAYRLCYRLGRQ